TSNSIQVTVNPNVSTSVSVAASATIICSGSPVTFTATPVNGGTPSYQWMLNGINVGTNNPSYTNNTLLNGDKVKVVMTSSAACTAPVTSNQVNITVNDLITPSVTIDATDDIICSGS